ncbi:MAG: hypothetical protein HMLKMBBP_00403 [Planctomycetes bacterium]|nr:hypothetical protein [Planctomycetota bacterium]
MNAGLTGLQSAAAGIGVAALLGWAGARAARRDPLGPRPAASPRGGWEAAFAGLAASYAILPLAAGAATQSPGLSDAAKWCIRVVLQCAAALGVVLLAERFRDGAAPPTGVARRATAGVLGGFALYAAATAVAFAVTSLWRPFPEQDAVVLLRNSEGLHRAALAAFAIGAAPLFEEVLYRGAILPALCTVMPPPAALALQALAFGAVHVTSAAHVPVAVPLAVVGWFCGWLYLRTGSLLVPVLVHAVFNAVNVGAIFAA